MFRASPWISYEPNQQLPPEQLQQAVKDSSARDALHSLAHDASPPEPNTDMDAPEISTLREEEEETPPPDAGRLSFSKFRVNLRMPARGQGSASSGSAVGPPVGPPPTHRRAPSPPDSDDDEEEDQLIDDDELAIVTETGRGPVSSPASLTAMGSPASTPSPRKRGGATRGRQRRGGTPGRRGRPGREPPDAAAMMSTFELTKMEQAGPSGHASSPPLLSAPPPPAAGPSTSTGDWPSATPPKPPRKKPGPKKGSTLGPRGPRKNAAKTSQRTSGRGTPVLDEALLAIDPSAFLVPAPPSIPPTPGPDQQPLPPHHLPSITPPDFSLDPNIPVPVYPHPTRPFAVQQPPKVPAGYATTHPIDPRSGPPRKWKLAQREIKGIAGGRWFARSWVGEKEKGSGGPALVGEIVLSPPSPPPSLSIIPIQDGPSSERPSGAPDSGPVNSMADTGGSSEAQLSRPYLAHPPPDTSPDPESPRSQAGTNGSFDPGEGLPRPS